MSSNQNEKNKENKNSSIDWKKLSSNSNAVRKNQDSLAIALFKKYQNSLEKK